MKLKLILASIILMLSSSINAQDNASAPGAKPKLRLYELEYMIMPMIATEAVPGEMNEEMLLNVDAIVNAIVMANNLEPQFNPDDIKAQIFTRGDARGVVYTFPGPYTMPLSKYGAIVFNGVTGNNYYTLESSINFGGDEGPAWVLGKTEALGSHSNFGNVPDCDSPEAFVDLLEKMGKLEPDNK